MKQQTQRRLFAVIMFLVLSLGVVGLVCALLYAARDFQDPSGDAYVKGVILTALAGALGTVLTLLGIIVKGVIDNLTSGGQDGDAEGGARQQ